MRKLLLLIFGALVALPAISQTQLGEISKLWSTKKVNVVDGTTYRYRLWDGSDTAIYYQTGIDTFEVTTTFKKISGNKPPVVLPDIITSIDDNVVTTAQYYEPKVNAGDNIFITTGWSHMKNQTWNVPHYGNTFSFIDYNAPTTGSYIELTCTCYKIEWYNEKRVNHGIASVQLDNGPAIDVDLYDARTDNNSILVYTTPSMSNATHKLRVTYTGRKNAAATATNLGHDYFKTFTKQ